jgi:hypothetical protein
LILREYLGKNLEEWRIIKLPPILKYHFLIRNADFSARGNDSAFFLSRSPPFEAIDPTDDLQRNRV